ncbi:MAG: hypothetical protein SO401_12650 [Blautia sp.]|nr:hypothetical protein [Blautia sp.]
MSGELIEDERTDFKGKYVYDNLLYFLPCMVDPCISTGASCKGTEKWMASDPSCIMRHLWRVYSGTGLCDGFFFHRMVTTELVLIVGWNAATSFYGNFYGNRKCYDNSEIIELIQREKENGNGMFYEYVYGAGR